MVTEQWERWDPISYIPGKYDIESVLFKQDTLDVVLFDTHDEKNKIRIFFEEPIDAYRITEETFRRNTFHELDKNHSKDFWHNCMFFFTVKNSEYMRWLSQESSGISESSYNFTHFSFFTLNFVLDVIATHPPHIQKITVTE